MAQQFVGITLPIERGNTGYFRQSTTVFEQVRSNFKNLVLTKKGERLMQPDFGCDITNLLFEQITEETEDQIKSSITSAAEKWMPFLEVVQVQTQYPVFGNFNAATVQIDYRFRSNPNVTDSITVSV